MEKTLTALFDGAVFRPDGPVDLEPNTTCVITIVSPVPPTSPPVEDAWDVLDRMTGTIDGPTDWSAEHDHYLYGTPKRFPETKE